MGRQIFILDIVAGLEIKGKVIGQSLLGGEEFVEWIKEKYVKGEKDREIPALGELQVYRDREEIIGTIKRVVGKSFEEIRGERGQVRQIAMDMLCRIGGLKGVEIGRLLGVDLNPVSQGRKRLTEKMRKDRKLRKLVNRIEQQLSI